MLSIDHERLRVELARLKMTKRGLAARLGKPPSTVSTWLAGAAPAPEDLGSRIEALLPPAS